MIRDDVGRRCVVFDRPDDPYARGLTGEIVDVYDEFTFRFRTDNGVDYEFNLRSGEIKVKFLDRGRSE